MSRRWRDGAWPGPGGTAVVAAGRVSVCAAPGTVWCWGLHGPSPGASCQPLSPRSHCSHQGCLLWSCSVLTSVQAPRAEPQCCALRASPSPGVCCLLQDAHPNLHRPHPCSVRLLLPGEVWQCAGLHLTIKKKFSKCPGADARRSVAEMGNHHLLQGETTRVCY